MIIDRIMFTLVRTDLDDWQALYVNGSKFTENHHITAEDVMKAVKTIIATNKGSIQFDYEQKWVSSDWAEENDMPDNLKDIPKESFIY